jgi:Flp pilus assembly protein TadG
VNAAKRAAGWPRLRRLRRDEQGQSAIEMALAMPIFLMVVIGMVQVALVVQTYCNATYACRNAARYAALHSTVSLAPITASGVQTMVKGGLFLSGTITPTVTVQYSTGPFVLGSTPTFSTSSSNNVIGNLVLVKATWGQTITIPFIAPITFSVGTQTTKLISR